MNSAQSRLYTWVWDAVSNCYDKLSKRITTRRTNRGGVSHTIIIASLATALSCIGSWAYASEEFDAVVDILQVQPHEIPWMVYCAKISHRDADSVYAIFNEKQNTISLVGIVYPERSAVRAFLVAHTTAGKDIPGDVREFSCKGNNIKLERDGTGTTLWITETFLWNSERLQHSDTHRVINMEDK